MTKISVDGTLVDVPSDYTLLQACEAAGAEIPRFCFHERLSIAGNCRMCSGRGERWPAQAAGVLRGRCQGPAPRRQRRAARGADEVDDDPQGARRRDGVPPHQPSPRLPDLRPGRASATLQDQAMAYGVSTTRFAENKRAVEDKYIGVMVRTSMNRLHPVHALRPLHLRGGRHRRHGRDRPWRGHGNHHLPRVGDVVPSCRAALPTCARWAPCCPSLTPSRRGRGSSTRRNPSMSWTRSAPTSASTRAAARVMRHHPAHQRCGERGVDFRQDAAGRRWP